MKDRKAVSPVIATVILVAVAITVAVGVAYWMGGISTQYTQFEKVEIQTGYATRDTLGWEITLSLKNSGSATATITHVFVNEVPIDETEYASSGFGTGIDQVDDGEMGTDLPVAGLSLQAGASGTVTVYIDYDYGTLSAGTTVNIKLHSAGGMDYIKLIRLT